MIDKNKPTYWAGENTIKCKCPCCEHITLSEERKWEICDVCFWEDDLFQYNSPDYEGGANGVSLNQARKNFKKFGPSKKERLAYVKSLEKM